MKFILYFNRKAYLVFAIFFLFINSSILFAQKDLENNLKDITSKLRCMTCQNQTIYDSEAEFSKDIKNIIREKLKEGKNEKEIINFIIKRYGEYIAFEPQFDKKNMFLWVFPFGVFIISAIFLFIRINKNKKYTQ